MVKMVLIKKMHGLLHMFISQKNGHQQLKYCIRILRYNELEFKRLQGFLHQGRGISKLAALQGGDTVAALQGNWMAIQLWRRPTLVRINWLLEPFFLMISGVINAAPPILRGAKQPVLTVWNINDFDAIGTCQMTQLDAKMGHLPCMGTPRKFHPENFRIITSISLALREAALKKNTSLQMPHRYLPAISPG